MIDILAEPSCNDIAWSWILTLFGTDGSSCAGQIVNAQNVNSPFADAFAVLTASLAFLGSMFLSYHVVAGIVQSAYSGKVLGERWHQIWAPLRVVFGFGLMIPIGSGFSSIHYVLRDGIATASINMANATIMAYLAGATNQAVSGTSAKIVAMNGSNYANAFFDKLVCAGVIQEDKSAFFSSLAYKAAMPDNANEGTYVDKDNNSTHGYKWNFGECGTLTLLDITTDKIDKGYFNSGSNDGVFSSANAENYLSEFNGKRYQATEKLYQSIKTAFPYSKLGAEIDQHYDSVDGSTSAMIKQMREDGVVAGGVQANMNAAANQWNTDVSTSVTNMFGKMVTDTKAGSDKMLPTYGFMVAGSYERSLSALSGFTSSIANQDIASSGTDFDKKTSERVAFAKSVVSSSNIVDNQGNGATSTGDDGSDAVTKVMRSIFPNIIDMKTQKISSDPVGDMILFGNNLLAIASYAIIALGLVKAVAAGASGSWIGKIADFATGGIVGAAISSLVDYLSTWVSWMLMIMVAVGLLHSFVLPMLPMIMIFTMGVSWLIMFLEASIAGVLWAFVFIRMDGNEFFDHKQSPGVGLLFNLFLRPTLGMLAFTGGIVLLPALLNALNMIWLTTFYLQSGNHGWGMVAMWQWLASIVMFAWMQWNLTLRITSLIPTITDRVGAWMGINASGYQDGSETERHTGAMIAAGQAMGRAPIRGGGSTGARPSGGGGGGNPQPNKAQLAETAAEVGAGAATAGPVGAATALASKASKK